MQDKDLDGLLALAALQAPRPSDGLMDRVLADAMASQLRPPVIAPRPATTGRLARLAAMFGGAPVLAGVVSAAIAGVAFGYLDPETTGLLTDSIASGLTGSEALDLFPSADFMSTEG